MVKRIANGKIYDTEKSELIHRDNSGLQRRALYVTANGAYFVLAEPIMAPSFVLVLDEEKVIQWLSESGGVDVLVARWPERFEEA